MPAVWHPKIDPESGLYSTDAADLNNWDMYPGDNYPEPYSWVQFTADYPQPCDGLQGVFSFVDMYEGYTGTVTLGGPVTTNWMVQRDGVIDQPLGHASDITVYGAWTWSGGEINPSGVPAQVQVSGMYMSGFADLSGALTLGSSLVFDTGTVAAFSASMTVTQERAGIDVQGGSQFTMLGESLINALNTLADRNTIRVGGAMTKFTTVGSTSSALGLWVMGGTAETTPTAEGVSVARFSGPIRQANGTAPFQLAPTVSCYMTNGNLIVDERTMLTVTNDRDILIRGGKLATRVLTVDDLGSATIVARTLRIDQQLTGTTTEIVVGDPALNPAGINGHHYSHLVVLGEVQWRGGVYRPLVDTRPTGTKSSLWSSTGTFTIGSPNDDPNLTGTAPTIGTVNRPDTDPLPAGRPYTIIMTDAVIGRVSVPTSAGPGWKVLPRLAADQPDQELVIESIPI